MNDTLAWQDVRCSSPTCDRASEGGRLLFRRQGDLCVKASRTGALIAEKPIGATCRCGATWRNPDLDAPPVDHSRRLE